jgi:hypothetical protein
MYLYLDGTSPSDAQTNRVWYLIHEMGHILGASHEHIRSDATACNSAQINNADNYLTPYEQASVMDYCRKDVLPLTDYDLTELDQLGMEILYPFLGQSLDIECKDSCFYRGTGQGVISRTNSVFVDEWSVRGALPWWTGTGPDWFANGAPIGSPAVLSAAAVSGEVSLTFVEEVIHTGHTMNGASQVLVDNSAWSAVARVIL